MKLQIEAGGELHEIELERGETAGQYRVSMDGASSTEVEAYLLRPGVLSLHIGGKAYRCVLEESAEGTVIHLAGKRHPYRVDDPRSLKSRRSRHAGTDGPKSVTASMPGRVVRVLAKVGDSVEAHQGIVVIEAMKMQNELKAARDGRIVEVRVAAGDKVASGQVLAVLE